MKAESKKDERKMSVVSKKIKVWYIALSLNDV